MNGEDWGLYLAVEGVEESFLLRNYGTDYGELYKPDSMEMGGGRGNGGGFDMDEFRERFENGEDITPSEEAELPEGSGGAARRIMAAVCSCGGRLHSARGRRNADTRARRNRRDAGAW